MKLLTDARKLTLTYWLLKITYGLYWGVIGVDKFFGALTESELRVSHLTLDLVPLSLENLLRLVGMLEIIIAVLILTEWPRFGALCGIVLMGIIVINLITMGEHYDIAIHGTVIAVGMIAFIALTSSVKKQKHG